MPRAIWDEVSIPRYPKLSDEIKRSAMFDVLIVGAGITGLMAAYYLKEAGLKVCVLERDRIASGDTGSTTAHLTYVTDTRLSDLVRGFGEEVAALVWRAGELAIDAIETLIHRHSIECMFHRVPGFLHASLESAAPNGEITTLKAEAALARRLGFQSRFETSVPIVNRPGINFSNQAKFHPRMFMSGLASVIPGKGCAIYEHSEVTEVESEPLVVHCDSIKISAKKLIVATNVPIVGKQNMLSAALFQTKIASYSSYVLGASIPKSKYPEVSLWDTSDPYFYLRVDPSSRNDYVIFGGNDHKTGQVKDTDEPYRRLQDMLATIIPDAEIRYRWSGQVVETHDGLPFIGEVSADQFIGTGYCGNGFTFGTTAALTSVDWVMGRDNPLLKIFSPHRKEVHSGGVWNYLKENADFPTCYLKDRLVAAPPFQDSALKSGEGGIFMFDGRRVACAKDRNAKLHVVDAICTHMGCLVRFNHSEATWDCPCHGSRFHVDGSVLAGPAEQPLEKVKVTGG